jgi:thymidylate synthase (FAD)
MLVVNQSAKIIAMTENPLEVVEMAGRVCYKSEDKAKCETCEVLSMGEDDPEVFITPTGQTGFICPECYGRQAKFIRSLLDKGHESVLEHASMTVHFVTDRGISHEIVRHRIASFSQESTRYCNYGNKGGEIAVIQPMDCFSSQDQEEWVCALEESERTYLNLIAAGIAPQHARSVLPTCLKTEIIMTANMREWRHFFKLRFLGTAGKPHPQIVHLCKMLMQSIMNGEDIPSGTSFVPILAPFFEDIFWLSREGV